MEKRKFLTLPGLELRPLGHPAHSQSLYRSQPPPHENSGYVKLSRINRKISGNTLYMLPHIRIWATYHYFPEGTTYAVSFKATVSIKYQNLIQNGGIVFKKTAIVFGVCHEGPLFLELECSYSLCTFL
jgi:hypothetical protein